jgi:hypothetical protein
MLNKLLIGAVLTLALAACASTPSTSGAAKPPAVARTQLPLGCVGSTGSMLQTSNPQHCAGFGSVYTRDDMDRWGVTNVSEGLQLLDPTLTVR